MLKATTIAFAATSVLMGTSMAHADWPEKPIKLIVSYSAGGGTDTTARILAPMLEDKLGTDVVVVNRPGAAGETGHTAIADAKPDGYTMGIFNIPPAITIPITRDAGFTLDNFEPVTDLIIDPSGISVAKNSQFENLGELVAYAKENPAAVTVATTGVGTDDHLAVVALEEAAGIDLTPVPFPGSGPARTGLLGGHVSAAAINLGGMMPYTDKVRILAHFSQERSDLAPDVPTAKEQGWDVDMGSERGLVFPAGVSQEVVDKTVKAVEEIAHSEAWKQALEKQFTGENYMGPADFEAHIEELNERYRETWKNDPWQ